MSDVVWTPEQESAIDAKDAKILVNAAAGSGKTAVLTSRIIKRLVPADGAEPVRADRLLVVTFTKAAAAEMRERIEKGLKKELAAATEKGDMKRRRFVSGQIKQLAGAKISTIDSFCQSLVKEYFHMLNVSPSFQIIQQSEEKLMRSEAFDKLSERLYSERNKSFLLLAECCARSGREDGIKALVEKLIDFSSVFPYPESFVEDSAERYLCKNGFFDTAWAKQLEQNINEKLNIYIEAYENVLINGAEEDEKAALSRERDNLLQIRLLPISEKMQALGSYKCEKSGSEERQRESIAESVNEMGEAVTDDIGEIEEALRNFYYPQARALADVALELMRETDEAKKKKSVLCFSDIERMTYRLLADNETVRNEIKSRYDEILIDEYQDTNALQDGIFEMLTNGKNLFMVGDMKQSIYRFRGSEPLVFRNKSDTYKPNENASERKITLSRNFRSRAEVLDSVNDLFESCMSRIVGEIKYDDEQKLNQGNTDYKKTDDDYTSEFVLLEFDKTKENCPQRAEMEAEYIAQRILDMKKKGFLVRDKVKTEENGVVKLADGVRPIRNSDILILMSSHKTDGAAYREAFARHGIDCCCDNEGFFTRPEIKLMMSLLRIIENPQQDIPFAAVMRSVVGRFTDDEIALIRASEKGKSFFDGLCSVYSKYLLLKESGAIKESTALFGEKVASFAERINIWRDKARFLSAERMVDMLYQQTGIYSFFCAADSGQAKANLDLFFERAKQFEQAGYRGLFSFLGYMEKLENTGKDLEGADFAAGGDCVRIMTIHKSKGLEIPVVFLAGAGKKFNVKDKNGSLLMHNKLGFSLDYIDYNNNITVTSAVKKIFESAIAEELVSEEMRKLYVALTRAKEKVIVTAHIEKTSKTDDIMQAWKETDGRITATEAAKAKTFADWLAPVAMNSEKWKFSYVKDIEFGESLSAEKQFEEAELPNIEKAVSIMNYNYPYAAVGIKSKAAVSDFKGFKKSDLAKKPRFMSDGTMRGAEFGTAVHKVMETLPSEKGCDRAFTERHIQTLVDSGAISADIARTVNAEKIHKFYTSELGQRLLASKSVHRESEFEVSVNASRLTGDAALCGEELLLQGVIDCWFEEEDGIVLIDYKTDRVDKIDEIHQKYDIQLELYADALEKVAKKRVKEKFIYLFSADCVIQC